MTNKPPKKDRLLMIETSMHFKINFPFHGLHGKSKVEVISHMVLRRGERISLMLYKKGSYYYLGLKHKDRTYSGYSLTPECLLGKLEGTGFEKKAQQLIEQH